MSLTFCHHQRSDIANPLTRRSACALCGQVLDDKEFEELPGAPHVLLPGCKCERCREARAKQKDRQD